MSRSFFDELESQLRSAAQDRVGADADADGHRVRLPRRRRPPWLPANMHLAPVLASVVVVLVVGAALVLLGHRKPQPSPPSSPPPGTGLAALIEKTPQKQLRREFAYISAATRNLDATPACQVNQPTHVTFINGTPDRTLLSLLGVLRRPATPADRVNPTLLANSEGFVYSGYERRASSADGETYYLVAARTDRAAVIPSDRCFALQTSALAQYLPKIPAALREQTQALQAGYLAYDRNVFGGPNDEICLVDVGRSDTGASCGITAAAIKENEPPSDNNGVYVSVVPDGVTSVTLSFPAARGRPAQSVTGQVHGNVYAIRFGGTAQPLPQPGVTWRAADGRVLKQIPVPTQAMLRAACRRDPVPCALIQDGGTTGSSTSSSSSGTVTARSAPVAHGAAKTH